LSFPYEQKTKFDPLTGPARFQGSYEEALSSTFLQCDCFPIPLEANIRKFNQFKLLPLLRVKEINCDHMEVVTLIITSIVVFSGDTATSRLTSSERYRGIFSWHGKHNYSKS